MRTQIKDMLLSSTNAQKTLSFLVDHPNEELLSSEIQAVTKLSKAGTYRALKTLNSYGLVNKHKRGQVAFYHIIEDDCYVKQFKVLKTVVLLKPIVNKLKEFCRQIILYGSASRGEDYLNSDIDLFIIAKDTFQVEKVLSCLKFKKKLQSVVKTMAEFSDMEETEPEFTQEINSGLVLWKDKNDT